MAVDGAQFEISGLLLNKGNEDHPGNLVMVDTDGKESLWPQMSLGSVCGPDRGTSLNVLPAVEMRWERWKELYPNTEVATEGDGSESTAAAENGWQTPPRTARPKMDDEVPLGRVLGIPGRSRIGGGTGGFAFAFQDLDDGMPARVVEVTIQSETVTVFWNRDARAAMAFQTSSSFSVQNGKIVDDQTQSVWTVAGRAVEGTRQGEHLDPVKGAYIASGRAWFDFQPDSELWNDSQ